MNRKTLMQYSTEDTAKRLSHKKHPAYFRFVLKEELAGNETNIFFKKNYTTVTF